MADPFAVVLGQRLEETRGAIDLPGNAPVGVLRLDAVVRRGRSDGPPLSPRDATGCGGCVGLGLATTGRDRHPIGIPSGCPARADLDRGVNRFEITGLLGQFGLGRTTHLGPGESPAFARVDFDIPLKIIFGSQHFTRTTGQGCLGLLTRAALRHSKLHRSRLVFL